MHSPKNVSTKIAIAETTHAMKTAICELSRGELSATNCRTVKNLSTNGLSLSLSLSGYTFGLG